MLPIVTGNIREALEELINTPNEEWKRAMVARLKEDNPEINSILLSLAQGATDPKKIVLAGYMVYHALELAEQQEQID